MRYTDQHKPQTRSRIVTAAARQIRMKGPDQLGVAAVMADAGLTHGGFYAHFASKDELIAEAVDAMFDEARRRTRALDDALADGSADLGAAFRGYLDLHRPIYSPTSAYGHFGRTDVDLPWERTDRAAALRAAAGLA